MKKTLIIVLCFILLIAGGTAIWSFEKLGDLDSEISASVASVENYAPSGEQGVALNEIQEAQNKYPDFFAGEGFNPADFSIRSDLFTSADNFKGSIEKERVSLRERLTRDYGLVPMSEDRLNNLAEITDQKFIKDIGNFAQFNPERVKLYKAALGYCEKKPASIPDYVDSMKLPLPEKVQTETVLKNAEKNLCPKL